MAFLICILWLIGTFTAYPKAKRWQLENGCTGKWANGDTLICCYSCLFFWTIVWIDFLCKKCGVYKWLDAPSKF